MIHLGKQMAQVLKVIVPVRRFGSGPPTMNSDADDAEAGRIGVFIDPPPLREVHFGSLLSSFRLLSLSALGLVLASAPLLKLLRLHSLEGLLLQTSLAFW